ncbi:MAG: HAMP domain-containing histidine kinase [Bacteroidia bacterium]|nr:MAG: HAMP domain-containing histidine kinase [Bacteroidia bacterium]
MFEILRNTYKDVSLNNVQGQNKGNQMLKKPDIIAGVSHEVRTQMNAIVAFSYLMNNGRFSDTEKREFSEQIIMSCEQLIGLFENFLDTAALETSSTREEPKVCDAGKAFETLTSEFRVLMRKKGRNNVILIQEDDLPGELMLRMDLSRINRILNNLFRNALDHTFSGFIKLGCLYRDGKITYYIKDSGQGLTLSRELLLSDNPEIHYSESQDTYSAMNLILARNLITALEGSIRVEANEAGGTSVFLSFPVKESSGFTIHSDSVTGNRIAI